MLVFGLSPSTYWIVHWVRGTTNKMVSPPSPVEISEYGDVAVLVRRQ